MAESDASALSILPQSKVCTKCGLTKPLTDYSAHSGKKSGLQGACKPCDKARALKWQAENPARVNAKNAQWAKRNLWSSRARDKRWREKNKPYDAERKRQWQQRNPDKVKQYNTKRRSTTKGKLECTIRSRISKTIAKGSKFSRRTFDLLGYSADDLKRHIERWFLPGMSWGNYGHQAWHIDHKIPLAAFNYETPDDIDFKRAWALENLQPMWAADNLSKGAKLMKPFQPSLAIG